MLLRSLSLLPIALLALGCGDPLVGTWVTHEYPGGHLPTGVSSYEESLTFGSDMTLEVTIALQVPKTASVFAGCTETCGLSGLRWDDSSSNGKQTLAISGTAHKTASRTGCASSADDEGSMAATAAECPPGMPGGKYIYDVDDGTLTTTSGSESAKYTLESN